MITLKNIAKSNIVFIAQLVERLYNLYNFLLFPKDGNRVHEKRNIFKKIISKEPTWLT